MELILVLLILNIASGFCINLQSLESYLENNAEPSEQRSFKELNENPEHVNPGRRIFKVLPVKPNKKWITKYQDQSENRTLTEEVPIAIIVAAKHNLDDAKIDSEYVHPAQKSEEITDVKINKTQYLKDDISPSSMLNTANSGTERSNNAETKNPKVPEPIVTRKSMHNNKDLKENQVKEDITFNDKINKYLNDDYDITDDEHYDDKLIQIKNDGNMKMMESEEKKPRVFKIKDDLIQEVETNYFKPTTEYKKELNDVLRTHIDESKILAGSGPHKDFVYKNFNLLFILNK